MSTYFISAIDTDAGKTIITGLLGKYLKEQQADVITMKLSQTGCETVSEDIEKHRAIMGEELRAEDKSGETCPYLFRFPASPHLAAEMEDQQIEPDKLISSIKNLESKYETLLVEGVGGLMVPINRKLLLMDFLEQNPMPVILVTSGRLGSINHTLLSIEVMKKRGMELYGVVYNHYPVTAPEITKDSCGILKKYLHQYYPEALWAEVPELKNGDIADLKPTLKGWFV